MERIDEFERIGMVERHLPDTEETIGVGGDEGFDAGHVLLRGDEKRLAIDGFQLFVEFGEKGGIAVVVDMGVDQFRAAGLGGVGR